MTRLTLSDPIGALVEWLGRDAQQDLFGEPTYVTAPLLTKQALPILKNSAAGDWAEGRGAGDRGLGMMRRRPWLRCGWTVCATARRTLQPWRLGLLAHRVILQARRKVSEVHA